MNRHKLSSKNKLLESLSKKLDITYKVCYLFGIAKDKGVYYRRGLSFFVYHFLEIA